MTKIYYNNIDIFSGLAPTPLVGLTENPIYYNGLWAVGENITLNGQITGKCESFEQLLSKQNTLISRLSSHFKPLTIKEIEGSLSGSYIELEDGDFLLTENGDFISTEDSSSISISSRNIYNWPISRVTDINFSPSRYSQLLDFSITFECYDSGKFSGYYGVLDPVNNVSFSEDENGFVSVSHNCSARGINTNTSATGALLNAKNYVSTVSGWNNISGFYPAFIQSQSGKVPVLTSIKETLDRFNNVYSIEELWSYDTRYSGSGLFRFSNSISSGIQDGVVQVDVNGSIEGGFNIPFSNLRQRYIGINLFDLASGALSDFSSQNLNTSELSSSFSEDTFNNRIDFSRTYDNNPEPNPYLISSVKISRNKRGRNSASFNGTFKYRGACLCNSEAGWNELQSVANSYNYYAAVLAKWNSYGMTSALSSQPTSQSIAKNKNACEITVDFSYDEIVLSVPVGLDYIDVTLSVTPSIRQYEGKPVFQVGQWYMTNLGYKNRAKYSLNGTARISSCTSQSQGLGLIKNYINSLSNTLILGQNAVMDQGTLTESDSDKKLISFNFTWSAMGPEFNI